MKYFFIPSFDISKKIEEIPNYYFNISGISYTQSVTSNLNRIHCRLLSCRLSKYVCLFVTLFAFYIASRVTPPSRPIEMENGKWGRAYNHTPCGIGIEIYIKDNIFVVPP